ncbi:DUF502 domain-containing protein [Falsihalocynthiibacter sp. SS001]|uniref:DUF502 domain-containing protein n=1 Tax=Falsihalocynthiibacter sp. SS001 TaxID=3349698 RepID=UPI0036D2524E
MEEPDNDPTNKQRKRGAFAGLRANFLTGIVVIAPIAVTCWLIWTVIGWIDGWVLPFIPDSWVPDFNLGNYVNWRGTEDLPGYPTVETIKFPGFGVIIFLIFTILVGWMTKGLIGRTLLKWGEGIVYRMPIVRSIYNGLKQIAETVFAQTDTTFDQACLIEYPRRGIWAIGFISTKAKGEINSRIPSDDTIMSVFLPTTPNPTSGFLLFLPKSDVIVLDMTVEDTAKLVISAGLVYPNGAVPPLTSEEASALIDTKAK